jgi:hypothetical protein
VDVLLGEQAATQNCAPDVPEMLDDDVKSALRRWVAHIDRLRIKYSDVVSLSEAEVRETIGDVQLATRAVDAIVERASAAAQGRVEVIGWISVIRVITGLLWAVVVAICFGGVYRPYVTTFKRLQMIERESRSFLGAAFDAIVVVSPESPFNIITSSDQFDHLMGQAMVGKSVLSCAQGPVEEQKLLKLLDTAGQSGQNISSWFSRLENICWWSLIPQMPVYHSPVASMINTSWWYGLDEAQQSFKVEVLAINRSYVATPGKTCPTLLVVRRASCDMSPSSSQQELEIMVSDAPIPVQLSSDHSLDERTENSPQTQNHCTLAIMNSDIAVSVGDDQMQHPPQTAYRSPQASQHRPQTVYGSTHTGSTGSTATYEGPAGIMSPRSEGEDTPPPSIAAAMPRIETARGLPTNETVLQIEQAVHSLAHHGLQIGSSSSGSATPPMYGRAMRL